MTNFLKSIGDVFDDIWYDHKRGIIALSLMFVSVWLSAFVIHFFGTLWWSVPFVFSFAGIGIMAFMFTLIYVFETWG